MQAFRTGMMWCVVGVALAGCARAPTPVPAQDDAPMADAAAGVSGPAQGAATASEAMGALEAGYDMLKFFPAGPAGGPAYLKALGGPLPGIAFCPTGGVSVQNAGDYLRLPNVACVGGSWVAPEAMMRAGDWAGIEALARAAALLRS